MLEERGQRGKQDDTNGVRVRTDGQADMSCKDKGRAAASNVLALVRRSVWTAAVEEHACAQSHALGCACMLPPMHTPSNPVPPTLMPFFGS